MTLEASFDARHVLEELSGRSFRMLIDGQLVESLSGETMPSYSPSLERQVAEVPAATADDVNRAVQAAKRAFPAWRDLNQRARAKQVRTVSRGADGGDALGHA